MSTSTDAENVTFPHRTDIRLWLARHDRNEEVTIHVGQTGFGEMTAGDLLDELGPHRSRPTRTDRRMPDPQMPTGYRKTVIVGDDHEHGRTRYIYGWAKVTQVWDRFRHPTPHHTTIDWWGTPRVADVYPTDEQFPEPGELPAGPAAITSGHT